MPALGNGCTGKHGVATRGVLVDCDVTTASAVDQGGVLAGVCFGYADLNTLLWVAYLDQALRHISVPIPTHLVFGMEIEDLDSDN